MAGRKILNGEFDLTRISFPIRCMANETALFVIAKHFSTLPAYFAKAAQLADNPVERMKMVIAADMGVTIYNKSFEKPLNPILGETYQARGQDGAMIFVEQTSHHPPISHYMVEHENYKITGAMEWAIRAGL